MNDAGKTKRRMTWVSVGAALAITACSSNDSTQPKVTNPSIANPVGAAGATTANRGASGTGASTPIGTGVGAAAGSGAGAATPNQPARGTGTPAPSTGTTPVTPPAGQNPTPTPGAPMAMGTTPPATGTTDVPASPPTPHGPNCLQPGNGNYTSPGPYKVAQMDVDLGMIESTQHTGKYTIYYPNPLETACPHPIVAWGNGTGVTDSNMTYDFLNSNAASWGMVVASSSEDNTGSGNFHKAGVDYLLKQNETADSMFYHKLSTRAGVGGHSQGGFGAGIGSMHPNVEALVVEGASFTATQKVSGLMLTGTADIVMNPTAGVAAAQGKMFVAVWQGGDHVGTETVLGYLGLDTTNMDAPGSQKGSQQFQRLYAAWFRCFLADDDVACKLFSGPTPDMCGICKDPGWNALANKNL
jgi:hypothetical protein